MKKTKQNKTKQNKNVFVTCKNCHRIFIPLFHCYGFHLVGISPVALQARPPILVHALGVHICGRNLQFLIGTIQG